MYQRLFQIYVHSGLILILLVSDFNLINLGNCSEIEPETAHRRKFEQCDSSIDKKLCAPPGPQKRENLYEKQQSCEGNSKVEKNLEEKLLVTYKKDDILVYTVATEQTDGFQRYLHTAHEYGIEPRVLAMGKKWQGGDNIRLHAGGGWKVNLLKKELEKYSDEPEKIILFTDGYDVVFLSNLSAIHEKFLTTKARILFGAESACWPDKKLADKYPEANVGKRFLNSGLYLGYVKELVQLLNHEIIDDKNDDQLFFTQAYIDAELREKLQMQLDHESNIFQNLNGAVSEIQLKAVTTSEKEKEETIYEVTNFLTQSKPLILHGNGPSKLHLNSFTNYVAKSWSPEEGCRHCKLENIDLEKVVDAKLPVVFIALFVEAPTPFLLEQLQKLHNLDYPKNKLHLFVHNNAKYHTKLIAEFSDKHKDEYKSFKQITPEDGVNEWTARDLSMDQCLVKNCDYYFSVDSISHLDNPFALKLLIQQNRTVVAPMLTRPGKAWSNFWGALTTDGFYARSNDYLDVVHNDRRGLWNVPFVGNCYLIKGSLLKQHDRSKIHYARNNLDADMAFCANLRDLDVFMFVSNRVDFGHLVNPETYDIALSAPDMYQIFENQKDWESRYIHAEFTENFNPENKPLQPCPDVYWFPIVSKDFTNDLIYMMESYGKWSDGSSSDTRLEGGYEAVPTRDIHMNQVGWERHWLYFLAQYVRPLQEHVFTGYFHDPPRSLMNFVVRYRPDEQPSLRPHHDSSTYTINIALNERGVDYEGGGCRFIRYNCSVVDTKPGWLIIHPGRLTHFHEGLVVTKGTRYIMIAFVDP